MEFKDLITTVKVVPFSTLRVETDIYFEAVVLNDNIGNLTKKLETFFGPPIEYPKAGLPSTHQETVEKLGGIDPGQTLYFWNEGNHAIFAMLWPWQDEKHTTLKIIKI